jgi:hypothetical protein
VGHKPRWVGIENCYSFWKDQVGPHLASPGSRVELNSYPGGYCFLGTEWTDGGSIPIVVLQRCH